MFVEFDFHSLETDSLKQSLHLETETEFLDFAKIKKDFIMNGVVHSIFTVEFEKTGWNTRTVKNWSIKSIDLIFLLVREYIDTIKLDDVQMELNPFECKHYEFKNFVATIKMCDIKKIADGLNYKGFAITKDVIYNVEKSFVLTNKIGDKVDTLELFDEYLQNKIKLNETNPNYKLAKELFSESIANIKNFCIYPTTYGIGVFNFCNSLTVRNAEIITALLKNKNLNFYNEFSDKKLVLRFKISKSKSNLKKF